MTINDKEFWDKFSKVFNIDVQVTVPKKVTKDDIILSLVNEGDFLFMGDRGHIKINLKDFKGDKKNVDLLKDLIWKPIENYILKQEISNNDN